MGKGANKQLLNNSGTAQSRSKRLNNQSGSLYGFLDPTLTAEATNPQGYSPEDLASMNTANQQSLGGSTAGITGQANLTAARTRNAGGFQGAIGSGSRSAQRDLSENALNIQGEQARLKEAEKQTALSQIMQLYGIDESTALGYLNSSNSALGTENEGSHLANQDFWNSFQNIQKVAGQAATAGLGGG